MSFIASFFAGLKAEVEWLIASLAVASGNSDVAAANDTQTADATGAAHRENAAPDTHTAIPSLAEQQADSAEHSGARHASDAAQISVSDTQVSDVATHDPANLLVNADFLIDTADNSGPAPSPGLTPISFEQSASDLSDISTLVGTSATPNQDFHVTLPEIDSHIGMSQPHPDAGEFDLASVAPHLLGGFSAGGHPGGGGNGGTPPPSPYISNNGVQVHTTSLPNFTLTLNFDSSVGSAPPAFVTDIEKVADFFTGHYTNTAQITINVGFGEVGGSHIGRSALGESISWYTDAKTAADGTTSLLQYSDLQNAYNSLFGSSDPKVAHVTIPGSDPFSTSGNEQYWVTTADAKALGFGGSQNPDGYVGFSSSSGIFSYNSGSVKPTQYDFMSVAAHEITEVMGRATLNGANDFGGGSSDFSTLDLFHFSHDSPGTPISSGTTQGYFGFAGTDGGVTYTNTVQLEQFNYNAPGDASDWALSSPSDAYDYAGGLGTHSAVSYADYLAVQAIGWEGDFSGTWNPYPFG